MSGSCLGDYERPRRPFPILSLSLHDLHWTLLLCILCTYVAIVIREGQEETHEPKSGWKGLLVVCTSIGAFVLAVLSVCKMTCGYGGIHDDETPGYENLENGDDQDARPAQPDERYNVDPNLLVSRAPEPRAQERRQPPQHEILQQATRSQTITEATRGSRTFSGAAGSRSPREEDIDCGLVLEAASHELEYNGMRHPKGTYRVVRLEPDGVCERQGACAVGDILSTIDGLPATGLEATKVKGLLRGRAGTSIILGLYTAQSRDIVNRHVVLAPSPSSVTLSPRDLKRFQSTLPPRP